MAKDLDSVFTQPKQEAKQDWDTVFAGQDWDAVFAGQEFESNEALKGVIQKPAWEQPMPDNQPAMSVPRNFTPLDQSSKSPNPYEAKGVANYLLEPARWAGLAASELPAMVARGAHAVADFTGTPSEVIGQKSIIGKAGRKLGEFTEPSLAYWERLQGQLSSASPNEWTQTFGHGIQNMAPMVAAAATSNPAMASKVFMAQVAPLYYIQGRRQGMDPVRALAYMGTNAPAEVLTEQIPLTWMVSRFGKTGTGSFLAGLMLREYPQEAAMDVVNAAVDRFAMHTDATLGDVAKQVIAQQPKTFVGIAGGVGLAGVGSKVAGMVKDRQTIDVPDLPPVTPYTEAEKTVQVQPQTPVKDWDTVFAKGAENAVQVSQAEELPTRPAPEAGGGMGQEVQGQDRAQETQEEVSRDAMLADSLRSMAKETGWAETGGRMITGEEGEVSGRTTWIPKAEWFAGMENKLSGKKATDAVEKYLAGEKLSAKETRFVEELKTLAEPFVENRYQNELEAMTEREAIQSVGQPVMKYGEERPRNWKGDTIPPTQYELAHKEAQRVAALPVEQGGLGLPPNNTAMDRANAMGFDTDAYHGSPNDINSFDNKHLGVNTGAESAKLAHFSAKSAKTAEAYLGDKKVELKPDIEAKVKSLRIAAEEIEKQAGLNTLDSLFSELTKEQETARSAALELRRQATDLQIGPDAYYHNQEGATYPLKLNLGQSEYRHFINPAKRTFNFANELSKTNNNYVFNNVNDGYTNFSNTGQYGDTIYAIRDPKNIRSRFAAFNPAKKDSSDLLAQPVAPYDEGVSHETKTREGRLEVQSESVSPGRSRGTLLGSNIPADFKAEKGAVLIGKQVNSPEDLANAAQVLRDPRYETLRVFMVKGGKIVFHTGLTSRSPGEVRFKGGLEEFTAPLAEQMKASGADGYYLLHNHPSGRATPSQADMRLTEAVAGDLPGFLGHVIIDHNEYANISVSSVRVAKADLFQLESQKIKKGKLHWALDAALLSPENVAAVGKRLEVLDDSVVLIARDSRGGVSAIAEYPAAFFEKSNVRGIAEIRRFARNGGAPSVIAVAKKDLKQLADYHDRGYLLDVIVVKDEVVSYAQTKRTRYNTLWGKAGVVSEQPKATQDITPYQERYDELAKKFAHAFTQGVDARILKGAELALTEARDLFEQVRGGTISHETSVSESERLAKLLGWSTESIMEVMSSQTPEGFRPVDVMGAGLAIARVQAQKLVDAQNPEQFLTVTKGLLDLMMAVRAMPSEAGRMLGHYGWLQRQGGYEPQGGAQRVIEGPSTGKPKIGKPSVSSSDIAQAKADTERAIGVAGKVLSESEANKAINEALTADAIRKALGGDRGIQIIMDTFKEQGADLNINLLLNSLSGVADGLVSQAKVKAEKSWLNRFVNGIMELFQVQILTGFFTHEVNVLSNAANMTYEMALLHPTKALMGQKGTAGSYRAFATTHLLTDIWAVAKYNAFEEAPGRRIAHLLRQKDPALLALMKGGEGNKWMDYKHKYIPGKAGKVARGIGFVPLGVEDAVFKVIAYRFELARQEAAGETVDYAKAIDFAEKMTFQQHTDTAAYLARFLDKLPALKPWGLFVKTMTNIIKRTASITPGVNLAVDMGKLKGEEGAEGYRDVAARMVIGTLLMYMLWPLTDDGDDEDGEVGITGYAPVERRERAMFLEDRDPVALRIGEDYYSFYRYSPVADFVGLTAAMKDAANSDSMTAATGDLAQGFYQAIVSKHFMQNVVETVDFVMWMAKYKEPEQEAMDAMKYKAPNPDERIARGVGSFGLSLAIPNMVPQLGDFTDEYKRKARTFEDDILRKFPGYREELPELLSVSGEPVINPRHLHPLSINKRHAPKDEVARWQMKLGKALEPDPVILKNADPELRKSLLKLRWEYITFAYENSQGLSKEDQIKALSKVKRKWSEMAGMMVEQEAR